MVNEGLWGFPIKNVIILVVTVTVIATKRNLTCDSPEEFEIPTSVPLSMLRPQVSWFHGLMDEKRSFFPVFFQPICSMYGIFTYVYHKFKPNVGKYSIHGASG